MVIGKFFNPRNLRSMVDIAKISNSLDNHMNKRCAYCNMDLGLGDEVPVVEFVEHLAEKHLDKIQPRDIETYRKLIKKMTR